MIERIAILGTGLLGTSAGLALRATGYTGKITGWNRSPEQALAALEMGALSAVAEDPVQAARESDVILLAAPVFAILDWMEQLAGLLGPAQLLTDVGSTKSQITEAADRLFNHPGRAGFLPGHPMAGKERGGAALAEPTLFNDAVWIFTDNPEWKRTPESAALVTEWRQWVAAIGARVIDLDSTRHDELVAWVSHLPQFVATALAATLQDEVGRAPELKHVGGRGLREMTRLGSSPFSMWRDIALTNTGKVEAALLALEQRLAHIRENLRTPELRNEFDKANRFRRD
ncbi:MAG TPA: prephenate dehydrogenase/arogenate dehydrogenase family protein [Terracidiphilus sp.]|nr:prephenate dehydrogenase/arogenate dehydrogenase family protein [Terracidiphilus sp.]